MKSSIGVGVAIVMLAGCAGHGALPVAGTDGFGSGAALGTANVAHASTTHAMAATTTHATGTLLDDPSGKPLAGVAVRLEPWKPCKVITKTDLECYDAIAKTTTDKDGHFAFTAPSGHYLLVIGTDSPSDFVRATIHDQIWLKGGDQKLVAPTLPGVTGDPSAGLPFKPRPAVEKSGNYRLVTMTPVEVGCIKNFDHLREDKVTVGETTHDFGLLPAVQDEWVTEVLREFMRNPLSDQYDAYAFLTSGVGSGSCGGANEFAFVNDADFWTPQTRWYGGGDWHYYYRNSGPLQEDGDVMAVEDPRVVPDPQKAHHFKPWP